MTYQANQPESYGNMKLNGGFVDDSQGATNPNGLSAHKWESSNFKGAGAVAMVGVEMKSSRRSDTRANGSENKSDKVMDVDVGSP